MRKFTFGLLLAGAMIASFLSCDSIYDDPEPVVAPPDSEEPVVIVVPTTPSGDQTGTGTDTIPTVPTDSAATDTTIVTPPTPTDSTATDTTQVTPPADDDSTKVEPEPEPEPEPVVTVPTQKYSVKNLDATSYTNWIYVNLRGTGYTTRDYQDQNIPDWWCIAIHRYDVKTNDGAGLETSYESLDKLWEDVESGAYKRPASTEFVKDGNDSITVDMSHMMEGYLVYAPSTRNHELGKWLDVDTSTMPPIYTPSNKVYLIRLNDNSVAAIRFTGFSNPDYYNTKGYISFDYLYPVNFKQ